MAYNVAMLSSVTTVVFNANPLLRYDGYYVAADALEMPNLAQRAGQWWGRLLQRLLLGRQAPPAEAPAPGETLWLALYGPLSLLYRLFVMFSIAIFVSTQYFAVGVFIALWSLVMTLGQPLLRAGQALRRLGRDGSRGRKGLRTLTLLLALAAAALFGLPLPLHTQVDGVLWLPDSGVLRAGQRGFAQGHAARSGQILKPGDTVVTLHDPLLEARLAVQVAREAAARTRWDAVRGSDPARATQLLPPLQREQAELAHLQERATRLAVGSPLGGRLWLNGNDDLPGQFFKQGAVLGYVVPDAPPVVRVIVEQADADLIRARTQAIRIRLPAAARQDWPAVLRRAVPAASNELPSAALGHQGGGNAATDPRDDSGRRALQTHFELELGLPAEFPYRLLGGRVSVRFDHEPEPLAYRVGRGLRRLFLAHFHD
jgi:putative peptide zinc metalloprotease protein